MNQTSIRTRQQIDAFFMSLYAAKSPESSALFAYIQRILCQFRLKNAYEVKDIVVEVYARAINTIAKGAVIDSPQAWIRRVALNVIREFRRAADKINYASLDEHPHLGASSEDHLSQMILKDDISIIFQAFEELSEQDQMILNLRIVHGLSWQEISHELSVNGETMNENNLRQKGFRALRRLRSVYDGKQEGFQSLPHEIFEEPNLEAIAE
jgi:RNA polymerase sigma factor (sigma-70 family)